MNNHVNNWMPAGRSQMLESRDCTVRATMSACGIDYLKAYEAARTAGRKYRKGFFSEEILNQLVKDQIITSFTMSCMRDMKRAVKSGWFVGVDMYPTLKQCMRLMQSGRYVVESRNHAFAVVNGVVYDGGSKSRMRCRVVQIFEIKEKS